MYLKQTKKDSGRVYLSIVQGYRKDGKTKTRTVESIGYLDELIHTYPDPIAHFKAVCDERNAGIKAETEAQVITIHPAQKIDMRTSNRKNIGSAIPLCHYNSLGIEKVLRNFTRKSKVDYDVNAVMRLLVMERILSGGSKLRAHANKEGYFFKSDFSDDDVYRVLDVFARVKEKVISSMNRIIGSQGRRDISHVFYDVTNYYFEIDEQDALRRCGVEKNNRPDPIIQLGLLQDANAIPLGYEVFSGNTNDCLTLLPVLKNLKREMGLGRVIVVADKGLNTSGNIAATVVDGNGFVFSQSIRATKSKQELRQWVLSDIGYVVNDDATFKIKSRQDTKTLHIEGQDGIKTNVDTDIKVVAYWSAKYEIRSRAKRAEAIEKAKRLVADPTAFTKATSYGAARFVRNISYDKKTGEVLVDAGKHAELDTEAIALEEACDGYYCIITSETGLTDKEIIDIYKGLWRIEEAFRITKSDLAFRPVYVSTPSHIKAHFLTCYIALTIMRLIQADLSYEYTAHAIIEELCLLSGTHEEDNWWLFDHRTELSDKLAASVGVNLTKRRMRLSEIKGILAAVSKKQRT